MWYSDFFHGLPQRAWRAAQTDEQTGLELELLVESLNFGPGDRLLDVFCGYGRHALPLARMGADVTGVDISEESIGELHQAAKTAMQTGDVALRAIAADFVTLRNEVLGGVESFEAAYCLGNSFSFFPHNRMALFVRQIADLLKPGGRLLVQSGMVAESVLPAYQERTYVPVGETIQVLMENDYDPLTARLTQHLTYYEHTANGVRTDHRIAEYTLYTVAELIGFLQQAGLTVIATYGTVDGDSYAIGDEGIWLLAEK